MAKKWIDPQGYEIPPSRVTAQEKAREKMIDDVFKVVWKLRKAVIQGKAEIQDKVETYLTDYAHNKHLENWKGNGDISDFANKRTVVRNVNESMDFTETILLAQQKIYNCMDRWGEKANRSLRVIMSDYFKPKSNGKLDKNNILKLKKHKFDDPEWLEAMDLIDEAIRVVDSRIYYNFKIKDNRGKERSISVNFSYVDADEPLNPAAPHEAE